MSRFTLSDLHRLHSSGTVSIPELKEAEISPEKSGEVQIGGEGEKRQGRRKGLAKTGIPAPSANSLTKQALQILDLKGWHCWRNNNAGVFDNKRQVWRKNSATKGISDILAFHKRTGLFLAAEIKAGKDKLSKEQEAFLEAVKAAGGIALVIRTTNDIEQLNKTL